MNGQTANTIRVSLPGGSTAELAGSTGGTKRTLHTDWLGSSRLSTSYTGRGLQYDAGYAPYGESYAPKGTATADLDFTGQFQDTSTGLYDFLYREYNPVQGRWISPDPAGQGAVDPTNPQSWNRYAYVLNNPLTMIDPNGLCNMNDLWTPWEGGNSQADANPPGPSCTSDPAGDANSYFNSLIAQSHAEDMARYQRMVDCGNNPGSCDSPRKTDGTVIWVYCGGSFSAILCLAPQQAIEGSGAFLWQDNGNATLDDRANALAQAINKTGVQAMTNPCTYGAIAVVSYSAVTSPIAEGSALAGVEGGEGYFAGVRLLNQTAGKWIAAGGTAIVYGYNWAKQKVVDGCNAIQGK